MINQLTKYMGARPRKKNPVHRAPKVPPTAFSKLSLQRLVLICPRKSKSPLINYLGNPVVNSHRLAPSGGLRGSQTCYAIVHVPTLPIHCAQCTHTLCPVYPYTLLSVPLHCTQCTHALCPMYPYTVPSVPIHCAHCTHTLGTFLMA